MKDIVDELERITRSRWVTNRTMRGCIIAQDEIALLRKRVLFLESTYQPEYRMLNNDGLVDPHWVKQ